ncbi:Fmp23p ASCRUDRAFT_74857, partial [Ascoidea rubescens DSM 1968]
MFSSLVARRSSSIAVLFVRNERFFSSFYRARYAKSVFNSDLNFNNNFGNNYMPNIVYLNKNNDFLPIDDINPIEFREELINTSADLGSSSSVEEDNKNTNQSDIYTQLPDDSQFITQHYNELKIFKSHLVKNYNKKFQDFKASELLKELIFFI